MKACFRSLLQPHCLNPIVPASLLQPQSHRFGSADAEILRHGTDTATKTLYLDAKMLRL